MSNTELAPDFGARIAADRAVMDWVDGDNGVGLVGCTPSMIAQVAVDAYVGERRAVVEYAVRNPLSGNVMTVPDNSRSNAEKMASLVEGSVVMTREVTEWVVA